MKTTRTRKIRNTTRVNSRRQENQKVNRVFFFFFQNVGVFVALLRFGRIAKWVFLRVNTNSILGGFFSSYFFNVF